MVIKLILQVIGKSNGGDDWDDKPYEYNAEPPYDDYWEDGVRYPIELKVLYFETNDWSEKQPCDVSLNSPYSVKMINDGAVAWIITDNYVIPAKTTYDDFVSIIEEHGGEIYERRDNK